MKIKPRYKRVLILNWTELPQDLRDEVSEHCTFGNDRYIRVYSEFTPKELSNGISVIKKYYRDQKKVNNFSGTLDEFIVKYCLQMEMWLIEQKFDLTDVDEILVWVCW